MIRKLIQTRLVGGFISTCYKLIRCAYEHQILRGYRDKYDIHKTFSFEYRTDKLPVLVGEGTIIAGKHGHIGSSSLIESVEGTRVEIGDYVRIGSNVRIRTDNYDVSQDLNRKESEVELETADVSIRDGVFIGSNVFITHGTTIGKNSAVGANSVVIDDIPANAIVGGAPAKEINNKR